MTKRAFQLASLLVVLFATLTPLANCFDTWDKGPDHSAPVNDTEMRATALVVGAGFVLVMARLTAIQAAAPQTSAIPLVPADPQVRSQHAVSVSPTPSPPGSSPPLPLRI